MERAEEIGRERLTDFTLLTALSRPKSVGSIQLKSNNYSEHPLIDPQYMSDERDVKTLVKGGVPTQKFLQLMLHCKLSANPKGYLLVECKL